MSKALTTEELKECEARAEEQISHTDYLPDTVDAQSTLAQYSILLRQGDKYTTLASAHKARSRKVSGDGTTAARRLLIQAEKYYEQALAELSSVLNVDKSRNPSASHKMAAAVRNILDRDVSTEHGFEPALSIEEMPRIIGSRSKYCRKRKVTTISHERRHWRERNAVTSACLKLLYEPPAEERTVQSNKLQALLNIDNY